MEELRLRFIDQNGEEQRVTVSGLKYVIGRHSESDLSIPDGRLSREHLKIERVGEEFSVSDCGSSNGTTLNGKDLVDTVLIRHGDVFLLGGGVRIVAELASQFGEGAAAPEAVPPEEAGAENDPAVSVAAPVAPAGSTSVGAVETGPAGSSNVYWLLPIFGIVLVLFAGGLVYLIAGKKEPVVARTSPSDLPYSTTDDSGDDDPPAVNSRSIDKTPTNSDTLKTGNSTGDAGNSASGTTSNAANGPASTILGATATTEQYAALFMRRIAQNDPRAFLTTEQASRLSPKIKQFSGSSAVADNISSARKSADKIRSLAASKNLKPQFLAVAAIAKLGNSRGDVARTAGTMLEVLDKLQIQLNDEFANDCLLLIAVYEQGAAGDFLKLRNLLQELAMKHGDGVRAIRTIWFLEKNGKITPAEFERALTFLAIGTITQNPKEFGVNAEALLL